MYYTSMIIYSAITDRKLATINASVIPLLAGVALFTPWSIDKLKNELI